MSVKFYLKYKNSTIFWLDPENWDWYIPEIAFAEIDLLPI